MKSNFLPSGFTSYQTDDRRPLLAVSSDAEILFITRRLAGALGYPDESLKDILYPFDAYRLSSDLKKGSTEKLRFRLRPYNGEPKWMQGVVIDQTDDSTFIISVQQIDDLIQSGQQQEDNVSHLHNLAIENTGDGIAICDETQCVTFVNKSLLALFNYTDPSDLLAKPWTCLFCSKDFARLEKEITRTLDNNNYWRGDITFSSGTAHPVLQDISITRLPQSGLIMISRDLSESKSRELQLRKLSHVASNTNSVVIICDTEGRIEWVNTAFENVLGFSLHEVKGRLPGDMLGREYRTKGFRLLDFVKNQKPYDGEIQNFTRNGEPLWFYVTANPIYDEAGKMINYIVIETDITLLKKAEADISAALEKERQLGSLKSRFVNLASHEFRTPLACILSSVDVMNELNERQNDEYQLRYATHLQHITDEVAHMTQVMNNIMFLGKAESGNVAFNPVLNDFEQFVDKQLKRIITDESLQPFVRVKGEHRPVEFDEVLMEHILVNLISNALKYSEHSQPPIIDIEYTADNLSLSVTDNGIGIPSADLSLIFSSFFRARNTESISGSGLGLVLVKQFVECHHGNISVVSEEGKGSCFTVLIPYIQPVN